MNWWWLAFELTINLIEVACIVHFVFSCLGSKQEKPQKVRGFLVAFLAEFVLITFENHYHFLNGFESVAAVLILFVYAVICLNGTIPAKLAVAGIAIALVHLVNSIVVFSFSNLLHIAIRQLATEDGMYRTVVILITKIFFFFLSRAIAMLIRRDKLLFKRNVIAIINFLIIAISGSVALKLASSNHLDSQEQNVLFLSVICVWILGFTTYFLTFRIAKQNALIAEADLLKQKQELQEKEIEQMKAHYEEVSTMRHDIQNSYQCIYELLREGRFENAAEYTKQMYGRAMEQSDEIFISTNNIEVDALLNLKMRKLKSQHTDVKCIFTGQINPMDSFDLCSILGNLLDNVIEANETVPENQRRVELSITDHQGFLQVLVKNHIVETVLSENPTLLTTKKVKAHHGIGHLSVKNYVEKKSGFLRYYEKENMFCCSVMLPQRCPVKSTNRPL